MVRLHIGCGLNTPVNWVNIDGSWNARFAKYPMLRDFLVRLRILPRSLAEIPWSKDILVHNVKKPLPYPANSIDAIYSSHLLEHLYYEDGRRFLADCWRVLRVGAVLRIVVPDVRAIVQKYLQECQSKTVPGLRETKDLNSAHLLQERLLLRSPKPPSGFFLYRLYAAYTDFHSHKWMYDTDSLTLGFQQAGFAEVQEMACHVSRISGIESVENPGRVLNGEGICIEGIKPGTFGIKKE